MKAVDTLNGAAFVVALAASTGAVWAVHPGRPHVAEREAPAAPASASPRGTAELHDHDGTPIPRRDYRRIVSASTIADAILFEIGEPDRVVAVAGNSARNPLSGFHFAGRPMVERVDDIERILSFHPDLVFVNGFGDPRPVARLREAGLVVFNLGDLRGLATLIPDIHDVAEILGHPERGDRLARALLEDMSAVAADVPESARPRAIYLSVYGGVFFGGAAGTSYHDVLLAAGLVDAASAYHEWPRYAPEQLLVMDPDVIVTNSGMRRGICEHAGLVTLKACRVPGGIVEVESTLIGDPGPAMVEAARVVRAATHGPPAR